MARLGGWGVGESRTPSVYHANSGGSGGTPPVCSNLGTNCRFSSCVEQSQRQRRAKSNRCSPSLISLVVSADVKPWTYI